PDPAEARGVKQRGYGSALVFADFGNQVRAWSKDALRIDGDRTVGVETIAATIESGPRIEFAHVRLEFSDCVGANIGRVGDDEVATGRERGAKIASYKCCARRNAKMPRIFARNGKGRRIAVGTDRMSVRQFAQECNQNSPRADAEIGDAQGM